MAPLTQEAKDKIIEKLNERVGDFAFCAICGRREWVLQDGIASVRKDAHEVKSPTVEPTFMLMIGASCRNCGNTHFLDISILELNSLLPPDTWTEVTVGKD